jgi:hypothetical protein
MEVFVLIHSLEFCSTLVLEAFDQPSFSTMEISAPAVAQMKATFLKPKVKTAQIAVV